MIKVDLNKAKEIKKDHLRKERTEELKMLDVSFMLALESGNQEMISHIAQKKQELRDVTKHPTIVNARSVEEIKGLKLEHLIRG